MRTTVWLFVPMVQRSTIDNKFWIMAQPSPRQGQHWASRYCLVTRRWWSGYKPLGHSGVFCGVGLYMFAGSSMAHSNEPTPTFPGSVSKEILHIADEKFLTFTFRCRRLQTLNWIDQPVLHGCANCTPLRANPRTPWSGRLEYSSLRIPGVVQCYARCWIEEIGLRRIPKRSEEYLTRPPLSTHVSSMMSSLMMMARTHNSGLQCWVWLMRGRVAGKPHKVFFPISAARDPRKVALITVVTIIVRELNVAPAHN